MRLKCMSTKTKTKAITKTAVAIFLVTLSVGSLAAGLMIYNGKKSQKVQNYDTRLDYNNNSKLESQDLTVLVRIINEAERCRKGKKSCDWNRAKCPDGKICDLNADKKLDNRDQKLYNDVRNGKIPIANLKLPPVEVVCTKEYKPVCGEKTLECVVAPCPTDQKTYGNMCELENDGAKFINVGKCGAPSVICTDQCGNGKCEEVVCMGPGCPCGESTQTCPKDCGTSSCPKPYHVLTADNRCVWSCSVGTTPDLTGGSNECVCKSGYVETSKDEFGRRVCTLPAPAACTDSDGGRNYSLQGTAANATTKRTDDCYDPKVGIVSSCTNTNTASPNCALEEYYCGTDGKVLVDLNYFACPNGCSNGACIKSLTYKTDTEYLYYCMNKKAEGDCLKADFNQDGIVNDADKELFGSTYPKLDINKDAIIDSRDYEFIQKCVTDAIAIGPSSVCMQRGADFNQDGKIDINDISLYMREITKYDLNGDKTLS